MQLWLDLETFSEADLRDVGAYRYAEMPSTEILLWAYAVDDGPVQIYDATDAALDDTLPIDLGEALMFADEVSAHGAMFDRTVVAQCAPTFLPPLPRWRCTMAQALSHALPPGLSDLCTVLNVPEDQRKLAEGRKLIRLFTMPQPTNRKVRRATKHTHPDEWQRFVAYARNDVEAMRECARRMPKWNWNESAIAEWHADQRMNDRGFAVDLELVRAGADAAENEKARLAARFELLTDGLVERPSQRAQFMQYLNDRFGLHLDNTQGETFSRLIKAGKLDPVCVELMQLSMQANKTSTAKYAALAPAVCADGRFRGGTQFAGAGRTRRWAGRLFQPQNLPSRALPPAKAVEQYIEALKLGAHDLFFDNLMLYGAAALRGCVIAPPGRVIGAADLSNIEGRKLSWFANERWKLDAFRAFDAGTGPDLYNITAVSIIGGDAWAVPKKDRNVFGKVPDLASGYQGGVKGYQTFARAYGVRMRDHWETISRLAFVEQAEKNFEKWGHTQLAELEIDRLEWVASEVCKLAWRARHPATVKLWYALQEGCQKAIRNWGRTFTINDKLKVRCVTYKGQRWMVIQLPSGRFLTYFEPRLYDDDAITYEGLATEDESTKKLWTQIFTHGGKLTGNVCQTSARDILAPAVERAEQRGYLPVLTVHDELVTEMEAGRTHDGLVDCLAECPEWAAGLPLAAAGFTALRYKKED